MIAAAVITPQHVEALKRGLREYLSEIEECQVRDIDVTALAHDLAVRLRSAPEPVVAVEADPTPAHGIRRPMMLVRGLDSDPFIRRA